MSLMLKNGNADSAQTAALAQAIADVAITAGDHQTAIPSLTLHRRDAPTSPGHCIYNFGLSVTAQGGKQVVLGDSQLSYGPGHSMLTTVDRPVVSHVMTASREKPYLGLRLMLDARQIQQAAAELDLPQRPKEGSARSMAVEPMDGRLTETLIRLVKLLDEPALLRNLAPLLEREMIFRLVAGPHGAQLQQLVSAGSPSQQIAKAVSTLKQTYTQALRMEDLAAVAHMSPSTFRQHFRAITGISPLQYQKQLRLQEARQLMMSRNLDASNTSALVGYESPSQFSRDYRRMFGAPPLRDVRRSRSD